MAADPAANLRDALRAFDEAHVGASKGSLSLALILTRNAQTRPFPLNEAEFVTPRGGQVAGLGGGAVKKILADHGVRRILSTEGGRTSRGNMERMRAYLRTLNDLYAADALDLAEAERYWVERVQNYFDAQPFTIRLDPAKSLRFAVRELLAQAAHRQREVSGTMYVGAVMQHLVGAKIDCVSQTPVEHHGVAVADAPRARSGDFEVGDVALHVTTAPGEMLIHKCVANLAAGLRPMIVTTEDGLGGAKALARNADVEDRLDVLEIEQFIVANIYEHGSFNKDGRTAALRKIIDRYNEIVATCETDPSLRIEFEE